uniref:Titin n=1 Tax=Gopherus evgoodei TaxID=1825980 RepID=A0A8C4YLG6_9SAUR
MDITKSTVSLAWPKPEHDGGSKITGYIIEAQKKGSTQWTHITTVKTLDCVVKNLTENEEYTFQVMAVNSAGRSDPRESRPVVVKEQMMLPEFDLREIYQKSVIARAGDNIKIEIPVLGRPRPTVTWKKEDQLLKQTHRVNFENTATATILTINECTRNDSGRYPLSAKNIVGEVSDVITVLVHDIPGPPMGPIKFDEVSSDFVIFSWEPPQNDGGVPISNYAEERMLPPEIELDAELRKVVNIRACCTLRLFVPIKGRPAPEVKWTREHGESLDKATIESTSSYTLLTVGNVNRFDSGKYILTIENSSGSKSAFVNVRVLDTPGAPQDLKIKEVTKSSVTLTWEPPLTDGGSKIKNYIVEKRESTRKAYSTVIANCHKTSWKVDNLQEGCNYYFRVLAENEYGIGLPAETPESVKVSERPLPPGKITVLDVTRNSVSLSWEKPEHDGGSRILGYIVEMQSKGSEKWATCATVKVTEATITGLIQGEEYSFRVSAQNEKGISDPRQLGIPVVAKDLVIPPAFKLLFTTFSVLAGEDLKVDIPFVGRPKPAVLWHKDNVCKVTKLLEGNEYVFRIMAVNKYGVGESLESEPVIAKNPFVVPLPPNAPEVSAITKDSMIVVWERPASDGGSEILGYVLEKRDKEGIRWTRCNKRLVSELRYRVTGLIENHDYEYRVSAENAAGLSEPSLPSTYYKTCDPIYKPGPPNNPKAIDVTRSSVFLSWGKPIYDGGSEIQGYIVEKCDVSVGDWTICTPPTGIKKTNMEVENLLEKHEYKFRICAVNKAGVGEHADVPGTVIVEEKLEAPDLDLDLDLRKIVNVRAGGSLRLFVPIRGRPTPEVKWGKMDGEIREAAIIDITSSFTSLVLDNVNRFDTGKYTLTLENSSGIKSAFVSVRVLDTPSPPVNLKIKEVTKDSVSLSWEPPLLDGGAKIKNYIVEKREATRKAYAAVATNCHKTSWKVDQLQEGSNYYFRVTAENEFGIGLPAETIDPIKVSEVPQPPGKITVDDVTRNSVLLNWSKPEHDGGSKILQYNVEMQVKGSDKWSECACVKALEALITNLTQGEEYLFRVIAVNEKGRSDPRSLAVPVVAKDLVIEPDVRPAFHSYSIQVGQDLKVEIPISGRPKPTVTWTKDGQPLKQTTRVNVNDLPNLTVLNIKETHKEDSGMYGITVANVIGQNIEYEFRVSAENIVGVGKASKVSECYVARDPCDPPGCPEAIIVKRSSITLQWTKPEYDGGSKITGYIVEKRDLPDGRWMKASFTNVIETQFTVTGLTEDERYEFRVIAKNAAGAISKPSDSTGPITAKDEVELPRISMDPKYK